MRACCSQIHSGSIDMAAKSKPTWIAVMDGAEARFFALHRSQSGQLFEEAAAPLKPKPQRWAREVAGKLDGALADKHYDKLVLVAPPRLLKELREFLSERVRATLLHQVHKNFVKLGAEALWDRLAATLRNAAVPAGTSRVATATGLSLPVTVVFRDMEPSPTVHALALKQAAKLGRKFSRLQNCRVTVEAPHHLHRKVKEFRIVIELKLPGADIAARYASGSSPQPGDVAAALREAFAAAERQLQDCVQRRKVATVRQRKMTSPRLRLPAEA
jgi:ribosome-associated translation inhibitor RaiA